MKQKSKHSRCVLRIHMSVVTAVILSFVLGSVTLFSKELRAEGDATKVVSSKDCLSCHESIEALAAATAKLKPNPHDSPHYGKELDCELCHHEHSLSENFCAQCHDSSLTVP
jgi:hypothetical protein